MQRFASKAILFCCFLAQALLTGSCSTDEFPPVEDGSSRSFVVFSDVQQGYGVYSKLALRISEINPAPAAAFCCGDLMLRPGNEAEWISFNRYSEPVTAKMPLYMARGNHDGNEPVDEEIMREMVSFPSGRFYFAITLDDCLFLILDTQAKGEENRIGDDQMAWLRGQLDSAASSPSVSSVFVFMHHPLYPQGLHKGSNLANAGELHQLFLQNPKIRAVFAGHDHLFNKFVKDGIPYITTGGGGGPLYHGYGGDYHHFIKVSFFSESSRINMKTIGIFNEVVENFDL